MNTQENNQLIAEFMGLDIIPLEQFVLGVQSTIARIKIGRKDYICPMTEGYLLEHLQYHTSWDWLMPVVVECFDRQEEVSDDLSFKLNDTLLETNIESLYRVVVEFIKEYNNQ